MSVLSGSNPLPFKKAPNSIALPREDFPAPVLPSVGDLTNVVNFPKPNKNGGGNGGGGKNPPKSRKKDLWQYQCPELESWLATHGNKEHLQCYLDPKEAARNMKYYRYKDLPDTAKEVYALKSEQSHNVKVISGLYTGPSEVPPDYGKPHSPSLKKLFGITPKGAFTASFSRGWAAKKYIVDAETVVFVHKNLNKGLAWNYIKQNPVAREKFLRHRKTSDAAIISAELGEHVGTVPLRPSFLNMLLSKHRDTKEVQEIPNSSAAESTLTDDIPSFDCDEQAENCLDISAFSGMDRSVKEVESSCEQPPVWKDPGVVGDLSRLNGWLEENSNTLSRRETNNFFYILRKFPTRIVPRRKPPKKLWYKYLAALGRSGRNSLEHRRYEFGLSNTHEKRYQAWLAKHECLSHETVREFKYTPDPQTHYQRTVNSYLYFLNEVNEGNASHTTFLKWCKRNKIRPKAKSEYSFLNDEIASWRFDTESTDAVKPVKPKATQDDGKLSRLTLKVIRDITAEDYVVISKEKFAKLTDIHRALGLMLLTFKLENPISTAEL